jgi:hypothetical protein
MDFISILSIFVMACFVGCRTVCSVALTRDAGLC